MAPQSPTPTWTPHGVERSKKACDEAEDVQMTVSRVAQAPIAGFLYQFNRTILELLHGADTDSVTIEGVVEDIDIHNAMGLEAVQCKYHEAEEQFALSLIYKPVILTRL
jgi:hypothetical protein